MIVALIIGLIATWFIISFLNGFFYSRAQRNNITTEEAQELQIYQLKETYRHLIDKQHDRISSYLINSQVPQLHRTCANEIDILRDYWDRLDKALVYTREKNRYTRTYTPEMINGDYIDWLQKSIKILITWEHVDLIGWDDDLESEYQTYQMERSGIESRILDNIDVSTRKMLKRKHTRY